MKDLVVATFNVENLEDTDSNLWTVRKKVLGRMLEKIGAHVLLLQEVHSLTALDDLLKGTSYERYNRAHTVSPSSGKPYRYRNLVILSEKTIVETKQYRNDLADPPEWRKITSLPEEDEAKRLSWERPILHSKVRLSGDHTLHVINLHLKSMNPTYVKGQRHEDKYWLWLSHQGWAEGYYISDVKRVGQALETRILIDQIFDEDGDDALIVVGGDFNAEVGSVPFKAIVGSVEDTQNEALRTGVLIPCELNVPRDKRYSLIHHGKGNMLDHLVVSQALIPYWIDTEIYNETLHDESLAFATDLKFPGSDHAPIRGNFRVPW
ncbi:MAG: endonuclease/exonuclease/phosphatase family protein [Candidatus Thermoplasmatota archaeon]|nr:endonuclease/exonuclease/phosphatase family protein [Candidatus Thermoplasmatota archaeon]